MLKLFFFLFAVFTATAAADTDTSFLRGLVARGMFESVEYFCAGQFQKTALPPVQKYAVAEELVRSRTNQLLLTEPEKQTELLKKLTEFEKELFSVPATDNGIDVSLARLQTQLQFAIADYSFGNEQMYEGSAAARSTLLNSIDRFKKCTETLGILLPKIGGTEQQRQATALSRLICFQQGLAQKSLALTFPPGNDRTFGLEQAAKLLTDIANLPLDEPAVFQCRIELASVYRLSDSMEQCRKQLEPLAAVTLPRDLQFALAAEMLRYHLAVNELETALKNYGKVPADAVLFPDFELALLELFTALEKQAAEPQRTEYRNAVLRLVQQIEQHSAYWGRRAIKLLMDNGEWAAENSPLLKSIAEEKYRRGQFADAVKLYIAVSRQAESAGNSDEAFHSAAAAAAVLDAVLKRLPPGGDDAKKTRSEFIRIIRSFAKRFERYGEASEYYLKGIDAATDAVKQNSITTADYISLLQEYAAVWKDSPKTPLLLLRAAVLLERQGQHNESLTILEKIPALREQFFTALSAEEKKTFQKNKARTFANEGKVQDAVNLLRDMIKEDSSDLTVRQLLAEILSQQDDADTLRVAGQLWTFTASKAERGSELWWAAREGLINVLDKQGKTEEAKKEYNVLKLLYPDLGGTERKQRLEQKIITQP
ncbi:MAG: hypothetical protein LBN39_10500 [Planctomycetaceae bacterium]|jgi:hypothetical protein|nr:hypothetical protein [Planctomycetaceae bacterium]